MIVVTGDAPDEAALDRSRWRLSAHCVIAAFGTYFCVYALRKPFTAATFEGQEAFGLALKAFYVASQVAGYTISKFIGIGLVSSTPPARRAATIVALVAIAQASLLLFGLTPAPWNAIWLFVNGLPLGMVFGLILGFLEGRRQSELLTAGLCASFILSTGTVKSVGQSLVVSHGVSEQWMPALVGLIFLGPLLFFVWLLRRIPPPDERDIQARTKRETMDRAARWRFLRRHSVSLLGLVLVYVLLTVGRNLRDDYAVEIWAGLDASRSAATFTYTELVVSLVVLVACGLTALIRDNRRALRAALGLSGVGLGLLGASVVALRSGSIGPFAFMTLSGLGLYLPYVTFHTTVFERLIAVLKERANVGYLMYFADAFGYLAYVVLLIVQAGAADQSRSLDSFFVACVSIAVVSIVTLAVASRRIGRHEGREV